MYKILNWNVEKPRKWSKKTRLAQQKILDYDADIVILTESSKWINLNTNYPFRLLQWEVLQFNITQEKEISDK